MPDPAAPATPTSEDEHLARLAEYLGPLASPLRLRMLRFLRQPHYLEEVASHLALTRQGVRRHLEKLVSIGVLARRGGVRETGAVTEYVVDPQALFLIYDEFEKLLSLGPDETNAQQTPTRVGTGPRRAPPPAAGPCLCIVRGLDMGRRIPLAKKGADACIIGRSERADLSMPHDPFVSTRHAEVRWDQNRFVLTDLRSTNGTTHNWQPVPRGGQRHVQHGDLIGIGRTLLVVWDRLPSPA